MKAEENPIYFDFLLTNLGSRSWNLETSIYTFTLSREAVFGKQRMNGVVGTMLTPHKIATFTALSRAALSGPLSD